MNNTTTNTALRREQLHALVARYEKSRDYYRSNKFNETMLRNEFLDKLFEILGWDIANMSGMSTNEREVLLEESLKADVASHSKKPDYTFRMFGERKFFLEAKKPSVDISTDDEPAKQVRRYGFTAGLRISVLSNFEDLYIYDTTFAVSEQDNLNVGLVRKYHYTDYEESIGELETLLGRESVYEGRFEANWDAIAPVEDHITIDIHFLLQINRWRLLLGKDILKVMPNIGMAELGDIVQSYINKILFLRVCEDRDIEKYKTLLAIASSKNHRLLVDEFRAADRKYNSGLFNQELSDKVVEDASSAFWIIIRQLYYPESPYSFAVLSSDILGRIYEIFLSKRFAIVDGDLTIVNKPENEDRDIVTTPNFIVKSILAQTIGDDLDGKSEQELLGTKIADIACGSGAFLLEAYQYVCDKLVDTLLVNDKKQLVQTSVNTYKLPFKTKRDILRHCFYGVDKDLNAVEACKFGLLLKLLEGENEDSLSDIHPILPNIDGNVLYGNSLLSGNDVPGAIAEEVNPYDFGDLRFDYIVGNPPYVKTEDIKKYTRKEYDCYPRKYQTAWKQYDKYFLFIERGMSLLAANGRLGFIVPSKFMKVGAAEKLRGMIAQNHWLQAITSFGAHMVFSDKSTYSSIVVLSKTAVSNYKYVEVSDIDKWRGNQEATTKASNRDSSELTEGTWAFCPDELIPLYRKIIDKSAPLASLFGNDCCFNGIQTSAVRVYVIKPIKKDDKYYYFKHEGKEHRIEKAMTRPFLGTLREEGLSTYRSAKANARLVYPYTHRNGSARLLGLRTIERKYPALFAYLTEVKDILASPSRDVLPKSDNPDEWHRYGRQQSLEACETHPKIIVGVLSQGGRYAIDKEGIFVASGGTAGYCMIKMPIGSPYSIYYLQAILSSDEGEWLASLYGEIFRGGYIARGTKVLKQIPIRVIDFEKPADKQMHDDIVQLQKSIIEIGDKIAKSAGNRRRQIPLERQLHALMAQQQEAIHSLYGLTENEISSIPKIKEIYATDRECK